MYGKVYRIPFKTEHLDRAKRKPNFNENIF